MTRGKLLTSSGDVVVAPCFRTTNMIDRMRGLLFRDPPAAGAGLLIDPCASIHTFFMSYAIDVVFLDREYRVLRRLSNVKPWRMSACVNAAMTLEMAQSAAQTIGLEPRMELQWQAD